MIELRKSEQRGVANIGWLRSRHSFSFGDYYDPQHVGFGPLLVINEDQVQPGRGFGTHGHRNMEIISYVLSGELCTATAQHAYRPPWMSSSRHVNDMCTTGHTPRRQPLNAGCEDKSVRVWSVASGAQVAAWSKHPGVPYCAKWAPRRLLAASACGAVCLWIPGREAVAAALGSVR